MLSERQKQVSAALKLITAAAAVIGIYLSAKGGENAFMGGRRVFMYFTIQSNIAIALVCALGLSKIRETKIADTWCLIKFVATVSITLTGMVFCFVLAPTMGDKAWNLQNMLTHVLVPLAAVMDFFVTGRPGQIDFKQSLWVVAPPLAYALYAGAGYLLGWEFAEGIHYPYFFLNWGSPAGALGFTNELPFMGCIWWILLLLAFLIAVGRLYLYILKKLKP